MTATGVRLMLADVDGTLVTSEKVLTDRAIEAVHRLHDAGIHFSVTSGRPPAGWPCSSNRSRCRVRSPGSTAA